MNQFKILLLRVLFYLMRMIPVRLAGALGAGLGRLAYVLDGRHRSITMRNITRVYPDKPRVWRTRIARESFAELGRTIFEIPHVFMRSHSFLSSRVQIEGEEELKAALARGKGAIIVACHHGNWELGALMLSLLGHPSELFYRPLRQASFETVIKAQRQRFGAQLHARQESLRWLPKALKNNACVGILIDQHIGDGMAVPFLGHLANTLTLPAAMALKYQVPVFGVALYRAGHDFRFRLHLWPIEPSESTAPGSNAVFNFSHCISRNFSPVIDQRPEMWLWSHQRWKLLEEHYKDASEVVYGTP